MFILLGIALFEISWTWIVTKVDGMGVDGTVWDITGVVEVAMDVALLLFG